jgi:hypothetical protein
MAAKRLGNIASDGMVMGNSATDKIGFYGFTPVTQPTSATQAAVTTGATTTQVGALANELRSALVSLGVIKGS